MPPKRLSSGCHRYKTNAALAAREQPCTGCPASTPRLEKGRQPRTQLLPCAGSLTPSSEPALPRAFAACSQQRRAQQGGGQGHTPAGKPSHSPARGIQTPLRVPARFCRPERAEHPFPATQRSLAAKARCRDLVTSCAPWSHPVFPSHWKSGKPFFRTWKPALETPPCPPATLRPAGWPRHAPTRFTGSLLDLGDGGQAVLQRLAAHRLQLADVVVGPAVAAAHLGAEFALADPLGEPLAHGVAAVEAVPAGRVLLAAAGVPLARGADEAAVAAVGDVAAGAAGAGALGDIAARRALGSGRRELRGAWAGAEGEQEQRAQQRHPHPQRAAAGRAAAKRFAPARLEGRRRGRCDRGAARAGKAGLYAHTGGKVSSAPSRASAGGAGKSSRRKERRRLEYEAAVSMPAQSARGAAAQLLLGTSWQCWGAEPWPRCRALSPGGREQRWGQHRAERHRYMRTRLRPPPPPQQPRELRAGNDGQAPPRPGRAGSPRAGRRTGEVRAEGSPRPGRAGRAERGGSAHPSGGAAGRCRPSAGKSPPRWGKGPGWARRRAGTRQQQL